MAASASPCAGGGRGAETGESGEKKLINITPTHPEKTPFKSGVFLVSCNIFLKNPPFFFLSNHGNPYKH